LTLKRRVVFGGTFDPVHRGHLAVANAAHTALAPDEFRFMPAGDPPHRDRTFASPAHRLKMLDLALKPYPWFTVDRQEIDRNGRSWTSLTLATLRQTFPEDALILLLGQDSANSLDSWHDWECIPELAHLVIMSRPDQVPVYGPQLAREIAQRTVTDTASLGGCSAGLVLPLQVPDVPVSSTLLRKRLATRGSLCDLVPDPVAEYIEQQGLYRD